MAELNMGANEKAKRMPPVEGASQDELTEMDEQEDMMQECIQDCLDCSSICTQMVMHCLQMGGAHAEVDHIGNLLDCAEICKTSADFMLRDSPLHPQVCGVCAQVCDQCGASCEQFQDDPLMQECAEICYLCATSCRAMAGVEEEGGCI